MSPLKLFFRDNYFDKFRKNSRTSPTPALVFFHGVLRFFFFLFD